MVNSISGINNINKVQNVPQQSAVVSNPIVSTQNAEPVYPVYAPIQPKGPQKLGEIKIPYANNANVYQLANGQKLVALKKDGPTTINTFVRVGSFNETDDIRGISHYIEHNLFNGSSELEPNQFVEEVSDMGGNYNASTGFMSTNYYIKAPLHNKQDLDTMLKIHSNMLEAPKFSVDMLEKEKGIVCSEIQMLEDRPYLKAENILFKNLFNIDTTSSDLIGGNVTNIQALNKNTVSDYYNKYYTPDNMTTVVVGDINPDKVAQKLNKLLISRRPSSNQKKHEQLVPLDKTVRKDLYNSNVKSAVISMGFVGPKNNDIENRVALDALFKYIVGSEHSKLVTDLEKLDTGASVGYEVLSNNPEDPLAIILQSPIEEGKQEEGLKTIYGALHNAKHHPISDNDLKNVKDAMKNEYKQVSESSMGLTSLIGGTQLTNDLNDIQKAYEQIDKLSSKDIMNAAKFFDLNKTSIVVLHPSKKEVSFSGSKKFHSDAVDNMHSAKVETYNLKNNMQVDYQIIDSPFSSSTILIKNDKFKEMKPGVSMLLDKMLGMGSANMSKEEYYTQAENKHVGVRFYADPSGIVATADTEKEHLDDGINMIKEVLFNPRLTQENFDKAKAQIKLAYKGVVKSPMGRALEEIYPNKPEYYSLETIVNNLDNVSLEDVQKLHANILQGAESKAIVTSSNANKMKALSDLQKTPVDFETFGVEFKPYSEQVASNKVLLEAENRNQASIVQVYKVDQSQNIKDTATMLMLNKVLGGSSASRLFMDLRENQKLAYSVRSRYSNDQQNAILTMSILTTTEDAKNGLEFRDNVEKSLEGFKKHTGLLQSSLIPQEELNQAKLSLLSEKIFDEETTLGKHSSMISGMESIYGKSYNNELTKSIQDVTPEDIQKMAQNVFSKNSVTSIIANKNTLDANMDYLSSIGEVEKY